MQWGIEDPDGAVVGGTCTDGWDAANVRISNDGGVTWNLLNGDDPYDFNYGYGWIYNESEYDCGGSLVIRHNRIQIHCKSIHIHS